MSQLGHSPRGRLSGKSPHVRFGSKVTDALRRRELTRLPDSVTGQFKVPAVDCPTESRSA